MANSIDLMADPELVPVLIRNVLFTCEKIEHKHLSNAKCPKSTNLLIKTSFMFIISIPSPKFFATNVVMLEIVTSDQMKGGIGSLKLP